MDGSVGGVDFLTGSYTKNRILGDIMETDVEMGVDEDLMDSTNLETPLVLTSATTHLQHHVSHYTYSGKS